MNVKKWGAMMLLAGLCLGGITVQASQVDQANQLMLIKQMEKWYSAPIEEVLQVAEQGDAVAQTILASRYDQGIGVTQDYRKAFAWYLKAAEQGDSSAQSQVAVLYNIGQGVPKDYRKGFAWYLKAAEQGVPSAQYSVGYGYANGRGVAQDYKMAYVWCSVAAANRYTEPYTPCDELAKKLTPAVLADAQTLAGEYFGKYQPKK